MDKRKQPQTEEHKRKIGEAQMGEKNHMFGIHHSAKTRGQMSNTRTGMKRSPFSSVWKYKLGASMRGRYHTDETLLKMSRAQRKENNANWQGGITPVLLQIRNCLKTKLWREKVFDRDSYTCVECGQRGKELNADRFPKMFSQIRRENDIKTLEEAEDCEELWDIDNGRTLCVPCHRKTFRYGAKLCVTPNTTITPGARFQQDPNK